MSEARCLKRFEVTSDTQTVERCIREGGHDGGCIVEIILRVRVSNPKPGKTFKADIDGKRVEDAID